MAFITYIKALCKEEENKSTVLQVYGEHDEKYCAKRFKLDIGHEETFHDKPSEAPGQSR